MKTRRRGIRERLRPPRRLRPTRAGWWFFAITFGVGFAAMNTGNNLLYLVLALMLAFLVLSGLLSEAALRGVRVARVLPRAVHADQAGSVALRVENEGTRFPAFALVIEDVLLAEDERDPSRGSHVAGRSFALQIEPGAALPKRYTFTPSARGDLAFAGLRLTTRFPFGLFAKDRWVEAPATLLVYPALETPDPSRRLRTGREAEDGEAEPIRGGALAGPVREFAEGDALRRVHWPSTLRRQRLHVRETEDEASAEVRVRLGTAGAVAGPAFEAAVSRAATDVAEHLDAGMRVGLETDSFSIEPAAGGGQRARLMAFLARVAPDATVSGAAERLEATANLEPAA